MSFHIRRTKWCCHNSQRLNTSVENLEALIEVDTPLDYGYRQIDSQYEASYRGLQSSFGDESSSYASSLNISDLDEVSRIAPSEYVSNNDPPDATEAEESYHPRANSDTQRENDIVERSNDFPISDASGGTITAAKIGKRSGAHAEAAKQSTKFINQVKDRIYAHINPRSIFHLLDFRPWFYPFTIKKYIVLLSLAAIITAIIISNWYTKWIEKSIRITRSYMLPVLIISVCAEPLIVFIILPVAKIPDIPKEQIHLVMGHETDVELTTREKANFSNKSFDTVLVIPCHNTDHVAMKTTIESALPHFRPKDIYIIDNGRSRYPSHPDGNFRQYIRSIHPDIVYVWSPIGSKNAAQLVGALAARSHGYKYIMTVDDDVCIPKNFQAPINMIDNKFKAVAFPIKAMDNECNVPLWLVAWQDVEYRLSGLSKLAEDRLCGVQFPHGAGWFVELETFITLMEHYHPMDFIAEDCNAGLGLSRMGIGIRLDARSYLATEVPTTFFGPGLNWWKQRQKSWEMGRHGRLFVFIRHFLWSMPPKKTFLGILWHKVTFFYLICTIFIDWLRVPTIVALGRTATWWRNAILLMLFSVFPPLAYNYWKCRRRPDMKVRFWACVTYPWYKQLYVIVALCGAIRWAGFFLGGHQAPPTIQEMLKRKDERCFWLDPRFQDNPAWLADEAETIEAKRILSKPNDTIDGLDEELKSQPQVEPPAATYSSAILSYTDFNLPTPPTQNAMARPRGSPLIGAVILSKDASASMSGPVSPLLIAKSSSSPPITLMDSFVDNVRTASRAQDKQPPFSIVFTALSNTSHLVENSIMQNETHSPLFIQRKEKTRSVLDGIERNSTGTCSANDWKVSRLPTSPNLSTKGNSIKSEFVQNLTPGLIQEPWDQPVHVRKGS